MLLHVALEVAAVAVAVAVVAVVAVVAFAVALVAVFAVVSVAVAVAVVAVFYVLAVFDVVVAVALTSYSSFRNRSPSNLRNNHNNPISINNDTNNCKRTHNVSIDNATTPKTASPLTPP